MFFVFLIPVGSFVQERELKLNTSINLIEVVYYYDNGVISQTSTYTLNRKLQGEWLSFNTEGRKKVSANYDATH